MKPFTLPTFSSLSRRERLLAFGGALVMCVVVLDRLVLGPWWRHTHHVRQEIARLEKTIRRERQLLERKPQILAEAEAYREHLQADGAAGASDMASLLREIETLGTQSGISLGEVKPAEGAANDVYQEYAVDVQYQGSLDQWLRFVYLLQTSKTLFILERAAVSLTEEGSDLLQGSLRVTGKSLHHQPTT